MLLRRSVGWFVVAGHSASKDARERAFVPATPIVLALRFNTRGRRDKPGDDGRVSYKVDRNALLPPRSSDGVTSPTQNAP
jgi:hypothetical protein